MNKSFTVAEILITLCILGIAVAMTLPALIQSNNNKVVEARLKKFYSAINQAILMAENDYGDKKYWYRNVANTSQKDENGNFVEGSNEFKNWFNTYLAPYLNIIETETLDNGTYIVYFSDGGALQASSSTTRDWWFYPGKPKKCIKKYNHMSRIGVCMFLFNFYPLEDGNEWQYHYNKGMEPYKYEWGGNIEELYNKNTWGCNKTGKRYYCTAVIQMNNWSIPKNYPLKVSY